LDAAEHSGKCWGCDWTWKTTETANGADNGLSTRRISWFDGHGREHLELVLVQRTGKALAAARRAREIMDGLAQADRLELESQSTPAGEPAPYTPAWTCSVCSVVTFGARPGPCKCTEAYKGGRRWNDAQLAGIELHRNAIPMARMHGGGWAEPERWRWWWPFERAWWACQLGAGWAYRWARLCLVGPVIFLGMAWRKTPHESRTGNVEDN
jgi:hypothetical protein